VASGTTDNISPQLRHIKDRLADTHDLQAEISLENERFEDAVEDSRSTLELRLQIEPMESELLAEAHYKLALALEFTFFKTVREAKEQEQSGQNGQASTEDVTPKMLYESVDNLVAAIISCEARIAKEESKIRTLPTEEANKKKREVQDVKDIVQDMMPRLLDLKSTVKSMTTATLDTIFKPEVMTILNRISDGPSTSEAQAELESLVQPSAGALAPVPGETAADRQARIQQATSTANDLTGIVRKKKEKAPAVAVVEGATNGSTKRRLEDDDEEEESGSDGKKVRFNL